MYLAIITLPLLGSIVAGFFGRKVGVSGAQLITCTCVIVTTLLAIIAFIEVALNNIPVSIYLFRWVDSESLDVLWGFHFDSLTVSMLIPVLIVSSLVHIYSIGYMSHDPHNQRFFSYLSLFTFMMIILVTANNFLLMFVGWEGVGICSYLLVSYWFTRIPANQSSMSAFLTNRVGDCFLTIGMFAILWSFGNIDYSTVFSLAPFVNEDIVTIIGICLLIGAMAKSSQVGLHVWLPMAMEGPTPVSALIHAATMVTAGVYLLMRSSPLIEYSSTVLILCLWLGATTTVFSSLIGLFQQDIKKIIAYSTMSQLGMMVIAVGLSSYNIALFHLVNHAFYKGLLFLGAGAVIHAVTDNQDFRKYGGLRPFLPLSYSVMLIASLSLVAFPFMTGFYSKDFILESAYGQFYFSGTVVYFIATIGAIFTTLYSVKVLYLTFLTNPNGPIFNYKHVHEGDIFMSLPLIILAIFSIFFGYITKDIFIGLGSDLFKDNSLFIHPTHEIMLNTEFAVPTLFKLLPLVFTISFSIIALILSELLPKTLISFKFSRLGYNIFGFFNQRFLIELFYNKYVTGLILKLGGQTTKIIDKGSIELLGPYGLEKGLIILSKNIASLDTGIITSYALYILIGLIFYILILYLSLMNNNLLLLILLSLFSFVVNNANNVSTVHSKEVVLKSKISIGLPVNILSTFIKGKFNNNNNNMINNNNLSRKNINTDNKIVNPFDLPKNLQVNLTSFKYTGEILHTLELQKGDLLFSLSPINKINIKKNFYIPLIPKLYVLNNNYDVNLNSIWLRLNCQDNISIILNKKLSAFKFTLIFIGELPEYIHKFINPLAYTNYDSFFVFAHFNNILEWYKFANSDIYRRHCNSTFNYMNCLYIIRNSDYYIMRKHFLFINNNYTKVVKGNTNMRHFTSDLEIRFNNYLLSIFNNNVSLVRYYGNDNINTINSNSNLINIEYTDSQIIELAMSYNKNR
jgi:NADH-ubiquinone oxidoreductase chain 5